MEKKNGPDAVEGGGKAGRRGVEKKTPRRRARDGFSTIDNAYYKRY
ncbi:MAG: hypothetical protein Q4E45_06705 [Eubacteriales bacterium]|nr:hypothetical protein [Eubacteriales bacterium]